MCSIQRNSLLVHVAYPKYLGGLVVVVVVVVGWIPPSGKDNYKEQAALHANYLQVLVK